MRSSTVTALALAAIVAPVLSAPALPVRDSITVSAQDVEQWTEETLDAANIPVPSTAVHEARKLSPPRKTLAPPKPKPSTATRNASGFSLHHKSPLAPPKPKPRPTATSPAPKFHPTTVPLARDSDSHSDAPAPSDGSEAIPMQQLEQKASSATHIARGFSLGHKTPLAPPKPKPTVTSPAPKFRPSAVALPRDSGSDAPAPSDGSEAISTQQLEQWGEDALDIAGAVAPIAELFLRDLRRDEQLAALVMAHQKAQSLNDLD
ncbi:hypothetical protein CERSUDRAFT_96786 [Gelatoporia subvermispora B]|uniref:Uncharacterized protein n=1 Tax=Ceriporiopsis subvermispora (strain B) TaxID=914234 RepID=M2PHU8_CERS8|nr:hypothetical protein CERSUDRAFT_96786 [Gelatoporia subvermispora B]